MKRVLMLFLGVIFLSSCVLSFEIEKIRMDWTGFEIIGIVVLLIVLIVIISKIHRLIRRGRLKGSARLVEHGYKIRSIKNENAQKVKDIESGQV